MEKNSKQNKIDKILSLLSGDKKPSDIYPECAIMIGYGDDNIYLVNGQKVSKEIYQEAAGMLEPTTFNITYGEYEK